MISEIMLDYEQGSGNMLRKPIIYREMEEGRGTKEELGAKKNERKEEQHEKITNE